jgi:formylmethanofuran dehydrogenase subunit D
VAVLVPVPMIAARAVVVVAVLARTGGGVGGGGCGGRRVSRREAFILIPGRTSRQGTSLNVSKLGEEYVQETNTLQINPDDAARLGLTSGSRVRLHSEFGQVELPVVLAKPGELPEGLLFLAYGDASSRLMGGDTHGTGMPTSKGLDVTLEVIEPS